MHKISGKIIQEKERGLLSVQLNIFSMDQSNWDFFIVMRFDMSLCTGKFGSIEF